MLFDERGISNVSKSGSGRELLKTISKRIYLEFIQIWRLYLLFRN